MLTGTDGPVVLGGDDSIFQFPVDISLFVRGVSSGLLQKSQDDDGSPFISQPVGDIGFIFRTIEYNSDEESVSSKQYSILKNGEFPVIEEEQQVEQADVGLDSAFYTPIYRFYTEYVDSENPKNGHYHIVLNTSERENLTTILNNLDNTTLLNLNKRRISVWKDGDESYDYQFMMLSPISDGCYMLNDNFHFDCSYHCFARFPNSGYVDISINITFTAVKNRGEGYNVSSVNAKIGGFAFEEEEE